MGALATCNVRLNPKDEKKTEVLDSEAGLVSHGTLLGHCYTKLLIPNLQQKLGE